MNAISNHQQKAFELAHRASEDEKFPAQARAVFRAIRHQLWLAGGSQSESVIEARKELQDKRCVECGATCFPVRTGVHQCLNDSCRQFGMAQ